jgi:hypothetical protein
MLNAVSGTQAGRERWPLRRRIDLWRRHPLTTLRRAYLRPRWRLELALPRHPRRRFVTRSQWGAAPPRRPYGIRGPLRRVVLHHTSRRSGHLADRAAESEYMSFIQGGHLGRGLIDVAYHFVIMPSGDVYVGRPLSALGAHAQNHNSGAVGICLAGNFDEEEATSEAMRSLERLLRRLTGARRDAVPVVGHGELGSTTCPGASLTRFLERWCEEHPPR